jgi:hypothetical protein
MNGVALGATPLDPARKRVEILVRAEVLLTPAIIEDRRRGTGAGLDGLQLRGPS